MTSMPVGEEAARKSFCVKGVTASEGVSIVEEICVFKKKKRREAELDRFDKIIERERFFPE